MKIRERIRLHLDSGRSIDGVLLGKRGSIYTLADARIEIDGSFQQVAGAVYVPKDRVEFAQRGGES